MRTSDKLVNRIGFIVLGLTNNFAYVIMLSAAYDLLNQSTPPIDNIKTNQQQQLVQSQQISTNTINPNTTSFLPQLITQNNDNSLQQEKYCNAHSTSTILLADTLPSLATKLLYPFFLVGLPTHYKAIVTAILSGAAFIITGLTANQLLIFAGVVCASFSSGLGESTYISNTHLYGDTSLSGWSIGTGGAGLFGAIAYAVLRIFLSIKIIMFIMLIVPLAMMYAFFCIIKPVNDSEMQTTTTTRSRMDVGDRQQPVESAANVAVISSAGMLPLDEQEKPIKDSTKIRDYGAKSNSISNERNLLNNNPEQQTLSQPFNFQAKLRCLPTLAKYFMPLLLVYFAEYFINQGLFELIYYPEITFLPHAAQYRWFQVSYQLGVMISRSSLDFLQIKNIWAMSLLQTANAILFLAHTSKLLHIPSFYIVIALIVYEGLLGGFTYVNTFYRIKKEVTKERQEFCMSTVTIADSLGIVFAGIVALPVHDALCKLYD